MGLVHRLKNSKLRQELQNNSVVDAVTGKLQGILQARRGENPAWVPFLQLATDEYNRTKNSGDGMMGSRPVDAVQDKVVQFNMKEASAEALETSQKAVETAEGRLFQSDYCAYQKVR